MIVLNVNTPFCNFKEDATVVDVSSWFKALNKLICSGAASSDVLLLDLIFLNDVAHEVLHNVPLSLLQRCFLHKLLDTLVVDHVLHVFLTIKVISSCLELLIADPLVAVEGPAEHGFLTAAEALGGECHEAIAEVAKPKGSPIVDALDHLVFVVSSIAMLLFLLLVLFPLLEIHFLQHTLVKDECLVVSQNQAGEAREDRSITTEVRE